MTEEMYTPITDHIEQAKARSVWQYKDKQNWDAGREIYAQRIQILEDTLWKLLTERALSSSVGVQLDLFAADYNIERLSGELDEDLRVRVRIKINLLRSSGQTSVLIFNLNSIASPRQTSLKQIFPLKILCWIFVDDFSEISADELERINNVMQEVKAAGVGLEVNLQLNNTGFLFSFTLSPGTAGRGFATTIGGTDGGAFAELIP